MKVTNKKGKNLPLLQTKEDQGTKELRNISVGSGRSVVEKEIGIITRNSSKW
jgi:hypothetical protein